MYFFPEADEFRDPQSFIRHVDITRASSPLFILKKFLCPVVIQEIIDQTNTYALQKAIPKWKTLEENELWGFLALHTLTGIVQKPSLKEYWSKNHLIETRFFGDTMSRDRYEINECEIKGTIV